MNIFTKEKDKKIKIHFIGVGGSGMNGLAELAYNLGFIVSGSDATSSKITSRLANIGIKIHLNHDASNLLGTDVVVYSTAIKASNPELAYALTNNILILHRAEFLGHLVRSNKCLAISGAHGKTTTSSMLSHILEQNKLDPSFCIGGVITHKGQELSAKLGSSELFVIEADESDASFTHINATNVVITNIDAEHMETYDHNIDNLLASYLKFIHNTPFFGKAVVCIESDLVKKLIPKIKRKTITYGFDNADIMAKNITLTAGLTKFDLIINGSLVDTISLSVYGKHNCLNALASIALALEEGLELSAIKSALKTFQPVYRRFNVSETTFMGKTITIIDDYGHHPEEITKTYETMRELYPDSRLISVFQPHRYTRTKDLFGDFATALSLFDLTMLTPVYSAGEDPIDGISSLTLLDNLTNISGHLENFDECFTFFCENIKNNDVILFQGAGSIMHYPLNLLTKIKEQL